MTKFRIQSDHPYCDCCALPNSGQQVAVGGPNITEAQLTAALMEDAFSEEVVRLCLECAGMPDAKLTERWFAPLQADVYRWFQPSSQEELAGWLDDLQEQLYARFS